ncbi:hypothetical protein ACGFJT_37490 [Actinomadura geliboluensis]|uniref:hypothetical protein n=1 Tax=Actinomadura geliboluensis TaxID=882440 RepID=UPI0037173D1A
MTLHVVQYSGGIGSWATAQRVNARQAKARRGAQGLVLLFADVLVEDPDLYRFLRDSAAQLGVPFTRALPGTAARPCRRSATSGSSATAASCRTPTASSDIPCRRRLEQHADRADTVPHTGIDRGERRRMPGIRAGQAPWTTPFPLCDEPRPTEGR